MIDFRYHLVSLVSVFLALAVGIVLGAGPLKDSISDTLSSQVQGLRQEKDDLRTKLNTATEGNSDRDDFITDVTAPLVAGTLTSKQVVLVTLPGIDDGDIKPLSDAITAAGGTVTGQVGIQSNWTDASKSNDRGALAASLTESVGADAGGGSAADGNADQQLARFLADSLVTNAGATRVNSDVNAVREGLKKHDLISIKGDLSGLASAALVLAPPNEDAVNGVNPTDDSAQVADASYLDIATALDGAGGGTVVTGPSSSALGEGLLAAVRNSSTAKQQISTVDSGSTSMGVVASVLALREQLAAGVGQYGFQKGASTPLPATAAASGTTATSPAA